MNKAIFEEDEDGRGIIEYPIFTAEKIGNVETRPGCWNHIEVAIMQQDEKDGPKKNLGTFVRNYSTNFDDFAVCQKFGRYFALYSPSYTSTRVMEITPGVGWKDIGGEENSGGGFCPTGYYIPQVFEMEMQDDVHHTNKKGIPSWSNESGPDLSNYPPGTRYLHLGTQRHGQKMRYEDGQYIRAYKEKYDRYEWLWGPIQEWQYGYIMMPPDMGFVSGCYWGDDSSWKIQYLDLSKIEEGIIRREERFGYIELPEGTSLKKAINAEGSNHSNGLGGRTITINVTLHFDRDTGNCYVADKGLYDRIVNGFQHSDKYMEREGWSAGWTKTEEEMKERWKLRHAEFDHMLENTPYERHS